jgi:hypothetical protein
MKRITNCYTLTRSSNFRRLPNVAKVIGNERKITSKATTEALQQAQVQNGVQLSFLSCWWSWFWVNSVLVFLELHLLCISLQGTALSTNI